MRTLKMNYTSHTFNDYGNCKESIVCETLQLLLKEKIDYYIMITDY